MWQWVLCTFQAFPSRNQRFIIDSGVLQVRLTGINSLSLAIFENTCDYKARLAKLLRNHDNIYFSVLRICRMILMQDGVKRPATSIDLFYVGRSLIVKCSLPGLINLQSGTRREAYKHVHISSKKEGLVLRKRAEDSWPIGKPFVLQSKWKSLVYWVWRLLVPRNCSRLQLLQSSSSLEALTPLSKGSSKNTTFAVISYFSKYDAGHSIWIFLELLYVRKYPKVYKGIPGNCSKNIFLNFYFLPL